MLKEIILKHGHIDLDELTGHYEVFDLDGEFICEGVKDKDMSIAELLDFLKMGLEKYVGVLEIKSAVWHVVKRNNKYYGGSVFNVGFRSETKGYETLEELYDFLEMGAE